MRGLITTASVLWLLCAVPVLGQTIDRSFLTVERAPPFSPKEVMTFEGLPGSPTSGLNIAVFIKDAATGAVLAETTSANCTRVHERLDALAGLTPRFVNPGSPLDLLPRIMNDGTSYSVTGIAKDGPTADRQRSKDQMTIKSANGTALAAWVDETLNIVRDCAKATGPFGIV